MGRVSGLEISSLPKISPREEKLASQGVGPREARLFFPRVILRWNFHTWNPRSVQKLYSCKSQPSDEKYGNFSMAIAYLDSYRNSNFLAIFNLFQDVFLLLPKEIKKKLESWKARKVGCWNPKHILLSSWIRNSILYQSNQNFTLIHRSTFSFEGGFYSKRADAFVISSNRQT